MKKAIDIPFPRRYNDGVKYKNTWRMHSCTAAFLRHSSPVTFRHFLKERRVIMTNFKISFNYTCTAHRGLVIRFQAE